MSLDAVIDALRVHVSHLTGLAKVHDDPPESMSEFPCAIVYGWRGNYTANAAGGQSLHTVIVEIHQSRQVLPQAMDAAKVWPDRMYAELKTVTGSDGFHVVWPFSYTAAGLQYAAETHYGVRFEVQVKVNET